MGIIILLIVICFIIGACSARENNKFSSTNKLLTYKEYKDKHDLSVNTILYQKKIDNKSFRDAKTLLSFDENSLKIIQGHNVYHTKFGHGFIGSVSHDQIGVFLQKSIYMEDFRLSELNYGDMVLSAVIFE